MVPSSGAVSTSLWDTPSKEDLLQWLDEVGAGGSFGRCVLMHAPGLARAAGRRWLLLITALARPPTDAPPTLAPPISRCQAIAVDVRHEAFEVQEEFAIGLGEVARARAAEKVRSPSARCLPAAGFSRCAAAAGTSWLLMQSVYCPVSPAARAPRRWRRAPRRWPARRATR